MRLAATRGTPPPLTADEARRSTETAMRLSRSVPRRSQRDGDA